MSMPLKWEFPGGKVEKDESLEAALIREIDEELSLTITLVEALSPVTHEYSDFRIHLMPYLAEVKSGQLLLLEHQDYKWLEPKEMLMLDWADADLPIARDIYQRFG